ncbi:MAG: hypothetical protein CMD74_00605 [Gammaproteobacteria bacterium]|nr:hypothetical protein [Gammaproteobacteria bacterium]
MIDDIDFATRHYAFEGCFNFRDIGGYRGFEGRKVLWGRCFRAGRQERMTSLDLDVVRSLNITTQIDLRMSAEIEADGIGPLESQGVQYVNIPVIPEGGRDQLSQLSGDTGISGKRYLAYLSFGSESWLRMFEVFSDPASQPTLIHCTAGKDRTGVSIAFLLSVLGVDRSVIERDYLLTNEDTERQVEFIERATGFPEGMSYAAMLDAVGVPSTAMKDFLDGLESQWGGPIEYLRSIGISDDTMANVREAFLEER